MGKKFETKPDFFGPGEATLAAQEAFAREGTEVAAYAAFSARCDQAVEDFKCGNLSVMQFKAFLARNGYTPDQVKAEIEQRIEEKGLPAISIDRNIG